MLIALIIALLGFCAGFYLGRKTTLGRFLKPSPETSVAWQQIK